MTDKPLDPREPDFNRLGILRFHNCWRCVVPHGTSNCEYPHARND